MAQTVRSWMARSCSRVVCGHGASDACRIMQVSTRVHRLLGGHDETEMGILGAAGCARN